MSDSLPSSTRSDKRERYREIRRLSETLCEPLAIEDYGLQSMADCSPPKWHLAHTTWFFETMVLAEHEPGFRPHHPLYNYLFNSYYESIGKRWPRPERGLLSRPTVAEIFAYRRAIDERMLTFLEQSDSIGSLVELGLQHEQQHQELLITDLKHAFARNPLHPAYREEYTPAESQDGPEPLSWESFDEGVRWIGHEGAGFAFDNETPRHRVFLQRFWIGSRPVTVDEYLEFMDDGGYEQPEYWLSDGWAARQRHDWTAPLYWEKSTTGWGYYTLHGMRALTGAEPVCHLSYYEADAFARWAGARLPTEAEWETAAASRASVGRFLGDGELHPARDPGHGQYFGDVWEWTASPYSPYPGFRPAAGAVGEYNGKFMCNQMVLRGGSCATPPGHIRSSYRNFFPPDARWQFSGVRLAKDSNG